jgi:hypothetical protein
MGERSKRRWIVLHELLKDKNPKVGAEIGIQEGKMTFEVLTLLPSIETYYAIDPWLWYPEYEESVTKRNRKRWNQASQDKFFNNFKNRSIQFKKRLKVLKMLSSEAAEHIPDGSLDFCFIDGNHSYEYVKEDIQLYLPKMKVGGLLGGHDYGHPRGKVKKAVGEMFDDFFLDKNKTWWIWI